MQLKTVVVVDDDPSMHKNVMVMLRPVRVVGTTEGMSAIELVRRERPELAIVDLHLPDSWGVEVVRALRGSFPALVIGVISGALTLANAGDSVDATASWFLEKPFGRDQLRNKIANCAAPLRVPPHPDEELALELAKRQHVQYVLELAKGNKSEAARLLKIQRPSLQRMLKAQPKPGAMTTKDVQDAEPAQHVEFVGRAGSKNTR